MAYNLFGFSPFAFLSPLPASGFKEREVEAGVRDIFFSKKGFRHVRGGTAGNNIIAHL